MCKHYLTAIVLLLAALLAGCTSPRYEPVITLLKPVDKVRVYASYKGDAIYQIQVVNDLPFEVSLVWNESVYVNTGGDATRLIHIAAPEDLDKDPMLEQKPSTIAARSRLQTEFVGESWIDYARRGVTPTPRYIEKKAKIYLSFRIKRKQEYWRAAVSFVPRK